MIHFYSGEIQCVASRTACTSLLIFEHVYSGKSSACACVCVLIVPLYIWKYGCADLCSLVLLWEYISEPNHFLVWDLLVRARLHYSGPFIMCHSQHAESYFPMTRGSIPHPKHLAETLIKRHFSKQNSISLLRTSEKSQRVLKPRENMLSDQFYIQLHLEIVKQSAMWCIVVFGGYVQ